MPIFERYTMETLPPGRTDWDAVDRLTDEEIRAAVLRDPDAGPPTDEAFWAGAQLVEPPGKQAISIRIDQDVLAWFRDHGVGYQTRMNAVLRAFMTGDLVVKAKAKRKARAKKG